MKKIDLYRCLVCDKTHNTLREAEACCERTEELTMYECSQCGAIHDTENEAFECCSEERIMREIDHANDRAASALAYWNNVSKKLTEKLLKVRALKEV